MSERLSVTTAREHVEDGHGGEYEAYCYRCQYFDEAREAAIWQLLAIEKRRVWLSPEWPHWTRLVGIGSDEYYRYTVWLGPLVIALWRCRDYVAREYMSRLRETAESDLGQADRDKQRDSDDAALMALAEARLSTDDGVRHDLDDVARELGVAE